MAASDDVTDYSADRKQLCPSNSPDHLADLLESAHVAVLPSLSDWYPMGGMVVPDWMVVTGKLSPA